VLLAVDLELSATEFVEDALRDFLANLLSSLHFAVMAFRKFDSGSFGNFLLRKAVHAHKQKINDKNINQQLGTH